MSTSDSELLRRCDADPEAFAIFYRRHLGAVLGFVIKRVEHRELAADLTAEVFAAALEARHRFDPQRGNARGWLFTIAANKITDSFRRGRVEDSARRRIGMEPVVLEDTDLERVELIASSDSDLGALEQSLATLDPGVRAAVVDRVVHNREYSEIARDLKCSESVVRKRVSRGLARLRAQLMETK